MGKPIQKKKFSHIQPFSKIQKIDEKGLTCGYGPRAVIVPSGEQIVRWDEVMGGELKGRTLNASHGAGCSVNDFDLSETDLSANLLGIDIDRDGTLDAFVIRFSDGEWHRRFGGRYAHKYSVFVPGSMRQGVGDVISKFFREGESVQLTFALPDWTYTLQGKYTRSFQMVEGAKKMLVDHVRAEGKMEDGRTNDFRLDVDSHGRGYHVDTATVTISGTQMMFIDKDLPEDVAQKLHDAAKVEKVKTDELEKKRAEEEGRKTKSIARKYKI